MAELLDIESDQYTVSAKKMLRGGIFMGKDVEINGIKNIQEILINKLAPLFNDIKVPVSVELFNEIFLSYSFELFLAKKYSNPLNKKYKYNPLNKSGHNFGHLKNEKDQQIGWQASLSRSNPKYIEIQIHTDNYQKIKFHELMGINEENIEEYNFKIKGEYMSYDFLKKIKRDVLTKFFLLKQK